jgi:hypothetical protein
MSINNIGKSRRGRPATGAMPTLVRLPAHLAKGVDAWAKGQIDKPGRPEAIRRLLETALASQHEKPKGQEKRMAPQPADPPGMERDNHGSEIPLRKRTKDDRDKVKRAKR